jgi:hypothetical protein
VYTPVLNSNGEAFEEGERLPINIRSGIFKSILIEKIQMDMDGLAVPPDTYQEYLRRRNPKLYSLLMDNNRFNNNKDAWLNDVMTIVLAVETELSVHMKYFEQSVLGEELFFKPLITLIKHFKSTLVDFARTGLRYVFADKMDSGGNSNMVKLFDEAAFIIHFVTIANRGYYSTFGIFDTEHKMKHKLKLKDRSEILRMIKGEGFAAEVREARMGSVRMVDEMKFYKNGKYMDPSGQDAYWISGEPGTGRWSEEDDILMKARKSTVNVKSQPVDLEGWKDFVESTNPN